MDFSSASSALSQIPLDWIIVAIFFIVVAGDALRAGSIRACALALSFPLSLLLFQMVSQTLVLGSFLAQSSSSIEQIVTFFVIEALLFVCLHHMLQSYDRYSSLLSAAAAGIAATVVVLLIWIQIPALQSLWHFGPQIQAIFGSQYRFFWLIGVYLGLAFVGS